MVFYGVILMIFKLQLLFLSSTVASLIFAGVEDRANLTHVEPFGTWIKDPLLLD